ncbi:TetR/AcrR family transcriptional regulator [Paenochrobactrum sp. BZR 588]|uniref:TetR/AcrR family transcriptional regulator n=1 Tax=Paenochrobactrum TaxID=999488 RepID=UPI0035BBF2D7
METKKFKKIGRPRVVDRNKVLDAAEHLLVEGGIEALTMDNVAREAGITKGGVQYCFGNKYGLMRAIINRWSYIFDAKVSAYKQGATDPQSHVIAHIKATRDGEQMDDSRFSAMMASLVPNSEQLEESRKWYSSQLQGLDMSNPADRMARLAFIACEGAFLLRSFNLFAFTESQWQEIYDDIEVLMKSEE